MSPPVTTTVTLGVFDRALIPPAPDGYDFSPRDLWVTGPLDREVR